MQIREAVLAESEPLTALARETYTAAYAHTFGPGDLEAHLAKHLSDECVCRWLTEDTVLVAEAESRLVGYVHIGPGLLHRLYVAPEVQNCGVGTRLLQAALDHPVLRDARAVRLDVWTENLGALKLYERFGFTVVDSKPFQVASGKPAGLDHIMERVATQAE